MPIIAIVDAFASRFTSTIIFHRIFHVIFAEYEAQVSIVTGQVINGDLPRSKLRAVQNWLDEHREQVAYIWTQVRVGRYSGGTIG